MNTMYKITEFLLNIYSKDNLILSSIYSNLKYFARKYRFSIHPGKFLLMSVGCVGEKRLLYQFCKFLRQKKSYNLPVLYWATAKLIELRYELLFHPSYFPELSACDLFLFPKWKNGLTWLTMYYYNFIKTKRNALFRKKTVKILFAKKMFGDLLESHHFLKFGMKQ